MKILIIGAGAIGTMLGVSLAEKNEVSFYVRESRAEKLRESGLSLNLAGVEKRIEKPRLVTSLKKGGDSPYDLAVISVKAYSLDEILADLDGDLFRDVMTCQNGIGNEEKIGAAFGMERLVSGVITLPVAVGDGGKVTVTNAKGGISFGKTSPGDKKAAKAAKLFAEAGFRTSVCENYRDMKWSKVLLNMNSNALSSITSMTMEALFRSPEAVRIEKELFTEALGLLDREGVKCVDLPGYPVRLMNMMYRLLPVPLISAVMLLSGKARARGKKMPSLYIDIEKGSSRSEIDVLNGAVEKLGRDTGVKTPWNSFICGVFHDILEKRRDRDEYRDNPGKLLEEALKFVSEAKG